MKEIYIVGKGSGTVLFHRSQELMKVDPVLVGGLLTSVNLLTEVEFKGRGIEAIAMDGLYWVFSKKEDLDLLVVASGYPGADLQVTRERLQYLFNLFVKRYAFVKGWEKQWDGDIDKFKDFSNNFDRLTEQWAAVEANLGAAEIFDLLGLFQQVFNALRKVMEVSLFGKELDKIKALMQGFYEKLHREMPASEASVPVIYDGNLRWDCLGINPRSAQLGDLRPVLLRITKELSEILAQNVGRMLLLSEYAKKLFPLLYQNFDRFQAYGFDKGLFDYFL